MTDFQVKTHCTLLSIASTFFLQKYIPITGAKLDWVSNQGTVYKYSQAFNLKVQERCITINVCELNWIKSGM